MTCYMVEKGIRGWICQAIHRYAKANNEFKLVKQKKYQNLMKTLWKKYDEDGNTGYFLEVDIKYSKKLFNSHKDLPFLPEKKVEKV